MSAIENLRTPSAETIARLEEVATRRLSRDEIVAIAQTPMTKDERRGALELIRWFKRRYPTASARLEYATRAYARWKRALPNPSSFRV